MRRWLAIALVVAAISPALAKGDKKKKPKDDDTEEKSDDDEEGSKDTKKAKAKAKGKGKGDKGDKADKDTGDKESSDDESSDDDSDKESKDDSSDSGDDEGSDEEGGAPKEKGKSKATAPGDDEGAPMQKQDLTGHDMGSKKKTTEFERDRFFVDKIATEKTETATLVQGSLTSSTFAYAESGGTFPNAGNNASDFQRLFTDLRLQTDFRHIAASRWEARVDARARFVSKPPDTPFDAAATGTGNVTPTHIQSGLLGQNEYEIRELWLIRNGERTDLIFGRQFIPDLGAIKIDGLRVDYASSSKFTFLGFGGLYPVRGSRSITSDYVELKNPTDGTPAGQFIGAGGFGAAYRTINAYGSFGGVVLDAFKGEQPRVFATSSGYLRTGPKLDFYHFALIDLVSSFGAQITNLSAGVNYKPAQQLRGTLSYNRVDTDALNIQAQAFLDQPTGASVVNNEVFLQRLATNQARGSLSAGLGQFQRFEVTVAMAYRYRPGFQLTPLGAGTMGTPLTLPAASSVEVYGGVTDRHSVADLRLGADLVKTFGVGTVAYQRSEVTALRGFAGRELASGKGEWEAEVSYATTQDKNTATTCSDLTTCYGQSVGSILSVGGTLYYRFNRDWFGIGQAYISRTTLTPAGSTMADPTITGLSGYARVAYRF